MLLATALIILVDISMTGSLILVEPIILILLIPWFAFSFLGHELAHKFLAQRKGLWAEFRTTLCGIMMTVIGVLFPIKFIAPG